MRNIKWAILGPGTIARDFAKAISEVDNNIYAVASRNIERAKKFANEYKAEKFYGDYDEMLRDENIDVVYISTPHCNHYEYIIKSLENNKHVFCEKAITVNGNQLKEIVDLANKKNLIVREAMTIYHMPLYKKLRELVDEGKIGKVKMIQVSFGSLKEYDVNNRFFSKDLAGGALLDIGTYALSFTRYFLSSQPEEILTTVKKFETGVDEQSGIILKNAEDEMAVISLTMRAKQPKRGVVAGEKAYITVENFPRADKATITYPDGSVEVVEAGETDRALVYEVQDMKACILNKDTDYTLQLSLGVMNIMDEVRSQWGIRYPFE
ncbi:putative dehydrogenase [Clostridium acetobutylicum]|uniref:Predicted dehydrogenase n=1 Tax=Clostridium acetobutylicum (strain ATCC 824 / DSM 792 / JCM 1419 / IAM 19013 / LMG 5710 / NBRC 13948 / NRRL B-527 / VKM B-1787 / 2291 / W) TaxID=272562 RepID=Q97DS2_CLOAB|nr:MULTISPECIES: Gfo/Idh/MocA family oxidoreductase [Clostridium]AAK81330.1 Predicted dehydrogenase [Clostridium acetobutylicum ATCC 824]ADZ22440.1 dehydrogenase [Clostridium acetobutylicum EA 2018]AEI32820.1 dehydrogenase [Clostridium acetobutylicum DSM 1731]AWV81003.1 gfo/Idh/MocA family oxidoreductase [Clostridium acetobutylicum]MBC2395516.1 Gfo/Idh/MocA family oxidoreductase [Clostridium acetobutylicum]